MSDAVKTKKKRSLRKKSVVASSRRSPINVDVNKPDVDEITTRVIRLAKQFEGKLVGWDCAIMKRTKLK